MLFLAVTGLMLAGILVAVSGGINRQRFEDTITSLVDQFQGQYNLVENVRNNRTAAIHCSAGSGIVIVSGRSDRGASDCAVVGRLVTSNDGQVFESLPVIATADLATIEEPRPGNGTDERSYIQSLGLTVASADLPDADVERYTVPWDATIFVNDEKTGGARFSLLIIKLPSNGMMRTFSTTSVTTDPQDLIAQSDDQSLRICVAPGLFGGGQANGVRILPLAPNVSGVQRVSASDGEGCA